MTTMRTHHLTSLQARNIAGMAAWAWGAVLMLMPGCVEPAPRVNASAPDAAHDQPRSGLITTAAAQQVRVGGAAIVIGEADALEPGAEAFLRRIEHLTHEQRWRSARARVERFPDVVLRSLAQSHGPASEFMARVYDEQVASCGAATDARDAGPWQLLIRQRTHSPAAYAESQQVRDAIVHHLEQGRFAAAIEVAENLPEAADVHPLLTIDRLHWHGMALLLNGDVERAARVFDRVGALAHDHAQPHQRARMLLLAAHAHQRAGEHATASHRWQEAVAIAASLLHGPAPVADPGLWEQAVQWQPEDAEWSAAALRTLQRHLFNARGWPEGEPAEATAWAAIGHWRLLRSQHDAALVAMRRAEAFAESQRAVAVARLATAQALARQTEYGAATALLVELTRHDETPIAAGALGTLGAVHLQRQQVREAVALLERAIAGPDWPGRAQAEADLGLALLLLGEDARGLKHLQRARMSFRAQNDDDQWLRSFANEAAYLQHVGRGSEATKLRERIRVIEASADRD